MLVLGLTRISTSLLVIFGFLSAAGQQDPTVGVTFIPQPDVVGTSFGARVHIPIFFHNNAT
jgi:hypothetical protein